MVKFLLFAALTVTLDADAIALQVSSEVPAAASTRPSVPAPQLAAEPAPVTFEITHVEASQPQIIRIFNLDEGTRVIEITHVETNEPQIIRILNPDEGTREIVLPPGP
jgi:hypothetical protein